jgi:hypothetical protein
VKRRDVLFGAGAVLSLGVVGRAARPPPDTFAVKLWFTDEAAAYPTCRDRATGYLRRVLTLAGFDVEFSYGDRPLRFEADDRRVERECWPRRVVTSVAGTGDVDPVRDVNLLVTDGTVSGSTVGYAYDHVAAVPGARFLAASPPADEVPAVVDYSVPAAVAQLLVHEVGHALGLDHGHGSVDVDETAVTASPMVSGYAWKEDGGGSGGDPLHGSGRTAAGPPVENRTRRLSMRFSASAERALRSYRGGLPV